ncbi:MFS transporter [Altererythrobacter sp. SALINAS58]|uniref:spinster family MFS transporter n=1 Tax=Alteripontixanthobacter muriae TaxID=2705546 RepID=UPI00157693FC|nr:MFS transporter [Alteripontixanthobacter muriae]NTZ43650.1 MFS transporter [Alteripontixanthobacter muriae]
MASAALPSSGRRAGVLAMLLLVYIFNFLDRQILSILAVPIKADLGLSDTELGALGGIAFAFLYSTLAIPLSLLADRTSRSWVITVSLAVWSGFTALCGLASNFWQMFLFRLGVGVGEAGGVAPSYAMIADYFPQSQRARALSIYSLGIPLGSAAGVLFGGYIATAVEWRTAFIVVGLAGVLIAVPFKMIVKDAPRGGFGDAGTDLARPAFGTVFRIVSRKPSFWLLAFGASFSSICGYGLAFWLPSLMQRSFGLTLIETSQFIGVVLLIGGCAGVLGGGWLGDRMGGRDKAAYARVPAIAFVLAVPLFAAGLMTSSVPLALALFLVPQALAYVWLGPVLSAVQHLVPATMRATASASFLFINNLIGLGFGSLILGAVSDAMTAEYGAEALRYSMIGALGFYLLAALFMAIAAKHLRGDWVD